MNLWITNHENTLLKDISIGILFPNPVKYYAYILKSKSYNTYYYGSTSNLDARLKQHNSGKVRYTKGRMPWEIHYFEEFETRPEAVRREYFFKSIDGYKFLKSAGII